MKFLLTSCEIPLASEELLRYARSDMGKIKVLSDTLISQIAAGEVVDRPASVVKELIENSIDAGATECRIEVEQGGGRLIAIRDNGCGMSSEDARMAFERHATSKISHFDDLGALHTYGFRGEALAAIGSVALVTLKTRENENNAGTEVQVRGGAVEPATSIGCPHGTEIVVRNLFFNTPARKKFLKMENTELGHIGAVVNHAALANPHIGFCLVSNGKTFIDVPPQLPEARISAILGKNILEDMLEVSFQTPSIHIHGFISRPGRELSSKRHQYLFINHRDVGDALVAKAVSDAYGSRIPGRMWPLFVLHIDIDPAEVDVNVHPRKLSVKFLEPSKVFRDVSQAVSQTLKKYERGDERSEQLTVNGEQADDEENLHSQIVIPGLTGDLFGGIEVDSCLRGNDTNNGTKILSQVADSYIIVSGNGGISIIDQHAAHERVTYERLKKQYELKTPTSQKLLTPLTLHCSADEAIFLKSTLPLLNSLGFECEEWSSGTVSINAVPSGFVTSNLEKIFREFLEEMMQEKNPSNAKRSTLPDRLLKSLACKSSVTFGMTLSLPEQQKLLADLAQTPNSSTCPHGRPTRVSMTFEELERKFYRRK